MSAFADLEGKVAVVTGGASGIGKGIAEALKNQGVELVIADIEDGALQRTAKELGATGIQTDVSSAESVGALATEVVERFGTAHVLVNNAGIGPMGRIADLTLDDWKWMIGVNLWGVIHGIHAFLPILKSNEEGGHVVNTSSMAGLVGMPGLGSYTLTKYGVLGLTEVLAKELEEDGSKVGATVLSRDDPHEHRHVEPQPARQQRRRPARRRHLPGGVGGRHVGRAMDDPDRGRHDRRRLHQERRALRPHPPRLVGHGRAALRGDRLRLREDARGHAVSATQPLTLPDEALTRFREALGADAVLVDEPDRDEYRDPYWFKDDRTYDSSVVLLPSSTEEVQALVRIANELGVALWTSSRGKNLGYGGPSPRVRGSAVVSLVRMNRVIEINPELAYAVVEPGVRWFDLHAALQEAGHDDLLITIPDLGWGSVVGNSLDNGITYMPYGQDFMAPCGMEVVLADGELVRTGMGAMPDNKTWHLYKRGLGPVLRPALHPVQLRDRHAHGLLAHAPARGVRTAVPDRPTGRPARAGDRHPPRAAPRRDDPRRAEHVLDAHAGRPVPGDHGRVHRRRRRAGRRADPGDRRPHRARAVGTRAAIWATPRSPSTTSRR